MERPYTRGGCFLKSVSLSVNEDRLTLRKCSTPGVKVGAAGLLLSSAHGRSHSTVYYPHGFLSRPGSSLIKPHLCIELNK